MDRRAPPAAAAGAWDVRVLDAEGTRGLIEREARLSPRADPGGDAGPAANASGLILRRSSLTGGVESVSGRGAPLAPAAASRPVAARDFLRRHAALFGLNPEDADGGIELLGDSPGGRRGLPMVRLRQVVHGWPVFQSDTRAIFDRQDRLIRIVGRLAPGAGRTPRARGPLLSESEALERALAALGATTSPTRTHAWRTWFPLSPGVLVPAWAMVITTRGAGDWYAVHDARAGTLLWRRNIEHQASTHPARFSVYATPGGAALDSPAPASPSPVLPGAGTQFPAVARSIIGMGAAQNAFASPDGWIADGGETTSGNNVDAYLDRDWDDLPDFGSLDLDGRPRGNPDAFGRLRDFLGASPRNFDYTPAPLGSDPDDGDDPATEAHQRGTVTQIFYLTNIFHDLLHALGFDEPAGNFQNDTFGRGGLGGDAVQAEAQQGADVFQSSNANISVPPDGLPPIMRMYVWDFPLPARDGGLDAEILFHELAHGVSNRLIGDAAGLNWVPGGGMGEGWSDFYALSLLNGTAADDPDGRYAMGAWVTYGLAGLTDNYAYGLRRFPITTDNAVNPLTWADADDLTDDMSGGWAVSPIGFEANGAFEVHNIGEIWGLTLWEVRRRVIALHGEDVPDGNAAMLQLVTDALKMTPIDPSFTEARDALLDADCVANACAHETAIWDGFADRGLGYGAEASAGVAAHVGVRESNLLPHLDVVSVSVDDAGGNHDGFLDPGETAGLIVRLVNPWRAAARGVAGATGVLTAVSGGITVLDAEAGWGALPALGEGDGDPFVVRLDAVTCGQSVSFNLALTSALGVTNVPVTLRVGRPTGVGAVQVRTSTPGGLAIPEANPLGVSDALIVGDDLEIADLDFRLDDLRHTGVGDLTVELKAPWGFGTDLVFRMADCDPFFGCFLGFNAGDDFLDTVLDDGAVGDLMLAGEAAQPFTGSWMASLNSPEWLTPDDAGQLSYYAGRSAAGTWDLFVADHQIFDEGELHAWSLLITPVERSCCDALPDGDGDGWGDACDCAPLDPAAAVAPLEVAGLAFGADTTTLSWTAPGASAGPGVVHDVVRGLAGPWPVGAGPGESCLATGLAVSSVADAAAPSTGTAWWYLVRRRNLCADGPYGFASDGAPRVTATCP